MRAEKFTLSNDLDVIYLRLPSSQNFKLILDVPVGAMHDPAGKEGLSHILEHTVFCGSESTSEGELLGKIREIGGWYNASTSQDITSYEIESSSEKLDNFQIIADTLRQFITEPAFETERVRIEKKVIINELRDGLDNLSRGPSTELARAMHSGEQSWTNIIGTETSISSVTSEDLKSFMKKNYDAGHMTLYVAGPLEVENAHDILEQTLSSIPNLGTDKKPRHQISTAPTDIRKNREDLIQNYSVFMFAFPNAKDSREKFIQFEAGAHLSSLLGERLRSRYGCFYSPEASGWNYDRSTCLQRFAMSNTPEDSAIACQGMIEFYAELDSILTDGILQGSLDRARFYLSYPDRIETGFLSRVKVEYEEFGELFDLDTARRVLDTITPDDVRAKAKQMISGLIGMYVQGPQPEALPSLDFMRGAIGLTEIPAVPVFRFGNENPPAIADP